MRPLARFATMLLLGCLLPVLGPGPARAQEPPAPVMQNVFFNVVWGSALGATLGVASAVLSSEDKSSPTGVRSGAFSGATAGGIVGLGIGLYLVYQGVTFDPAASSFQGVGGPPPLPPLALLRDPPFRLVTAPGNPLRITGFTARVIDLRF